MSQAWEIHARETCKKSCKRTTQWRHAQLPVQKNHARSIQTQEPWRNVKGDAIEHTRELITWDHAQEPCMRVMHRKAIHNISASERRIEKSCSRVIPWYLYTPKPSTRNHAQISHTKKQTSCTMARTNLNRHRSETYRTSWQPGREC